MPELTAEIADTPYKHSTGLMGRKKLGENSGMLFVFPEKRQLSFWMANTYLPLQIAFIDDSGRIKQIESMAPLSTRSIPAKEKCRYALEVNEGWFDKNGIQIGAQVAFPPMGPTPGVDQSTADAVGDKMMGMPGQGQEQQMQPDIKILQDRKEILKAIQNQRARVKIQFRTIDGHLVPAALIDPDFVFVEGKEDRDDRSPTMDSQILVFDNRHGHEIRIIVDNILTITDETGNPITSVADVERIGKQKPLTTEEEAVAKGKESPRTEILGEKPQAR